MTKGLSMHSLLNVEIKCELRNDYWVGDKEVIDYTDILRSIVRMNYWGPARVGSRVSEAWMARRERYRYIERDKERFCS